MSQWVYEIDGNVPLAGEVRIQGSKNAVLPMLAATVLQQGCVILKNCPDIADVRCMLEILQYIGADVHRAGDEVCVICSSLDSFEIPEDLAGRMRSSVLLMGGLLGRLGNVEVRYPGGCVIGRRPIDLHLEVLAALGTEIQDMDGKVLGKCKKLQGKAYTFPRVSVGATENALLAAVCAEGETQLNNCAREPEIHHLCEFLRQMGADIRESGEQIVIRGQKALHGCTFTVPTDRIAAGTYLLAGAATRGKITLLNPPIEEMQSQLGLYRKMGGQYEVKSGTLLLHSRTIHQPLVHVKTAAYPGFPTDLQSPLLAVLTTVNGISCIEESIFEDRFRAAWQMKNMGADIRIQGQCAVVYGGVLTGAKVCAEDLRGGAALVIAGLAAHGHTVVSGIEHLERGYVNLCDSLNMLGGRCVKVLKAEIT